MYRLTEYPHVYTVHNRSQPLPLLEVSAAKLALFLHAPRSKQPSPTQLDASLLHTPLVFRHGRIMYGEQEHWISVGAGAGFCLTAGSSETRSGKNYRSTKSGRGWRHVGGNRLDNQHGW